MDSKFVTDPQPNDMTNTNQQSDAASHPFSDSLISKEGNSSNTDYRDTVTPSTEAQFSLELQTLRKKLELTISIAQERLRQARYSFDLALVMTGGSAFISLVGVGLLWSGQASEGTITAAGGLASSVHCLQLAKEANEKLDKIVEELGQK